MSRVSQRARKSNPKYAEEDVADDFHENTSHEDVDQNSPDNRTAKKGARKATNKKEKFDDGFEAEDGEKSMLSKRSAVKVSSNDNKRRKITNEEYEAHLEEIVKNAADDVDDENTATDGDYKLTRSSMEAGQILEMYLENFMCHRKFSMKFCKNVNFISGKNGSGKSSIVSALQVCLGSTARTAGRGSRMDEYIREGSAGPAIIKITMVNEGPDAFHPEDYGSRITVERRISRTSGSCYILYDEHGKEVSRKKGDLEKMLQMFNIYVDNPCNVMTQEESKKFIRSKNKDKYAFFLKATGLSRLKENLHETQQDIEDALVELDKQQDRIEKKKESVQEIEELLNKMKDLESMEDRIRICRAKAFWDDVRVAEDELSTTQKEFDDKERLLAQAVAAYEKAMNVDNNADEEVARIEETMKELTEECNRVETDCSAKQEEIGRTTAELRTAKSELTKAERARDDFVQRKKQVEKQINELRQRALQSAAADTRGIVEEMNHLEETLTKAKEEDSTLRNSKHELSNRINHSEGSLRRAGSEVNSLNTQIQQQNQDIQNLQRESSTGSRRANGLYSKPIMDLHNRVQQDRAKFHDQVYGPLGMHITLKEEYTDYEKAIERAIGPALGVFVVSNDHDRRLLQELVNKDRSMQSNMRVIMQSPHARYQVPTYPPHVVTAAMVIQCEHDLLFNCLVDQFNIEKIALVRMNREGLDDYVDRSGPMKTLKYQLVSVIDNERADILSFRSGNTSNDPNRFGFKGYLSRDLSSVIDSASQELQTKRERLQQAEEFRSTETETLRTLRSQDSQITNRLRELETKQRDYQRRIDALQMKLEEANEVGNIDTSMQEEERDELDYNIRDLEPQIAAFKERQTLIANALKTLGVAKKDLDAHRQRILDRIQEQDQEIQRLIAARASEKRRAEGLKKRVDDKTREIEADKKKVDKAIEKAAASLAAAEQQTRAILPAWDEKPLRLSRNENRATLERQGRELQAKFNAAKREAGLQGYSLEILQERFDKANAEYTEMQEIVEALATNIENLQNSQKERETKWSKALRYCTKSVKNAFDKYASRKGSAGTVRFNHQELTLDIQVQVDSTDENSLANDIMNLSGGERSYVTFCLQLALGHVIECPFRLLDEYDVFMDEATRSLSLQMMQRYALERPDQRQRQFLILTPHRMNEVTASKEVKVLYMPEPQRISAQGPQQQTL